jgi:hypothetical protein
MSGDQLTTSDLVAGSPVQEVDSTAELDPTPAGPASSSDTVPFIRESWLQPPPKVPAGGSGLPVVDTTALPAFGSVHHRGLGGWGRVAVAAAVVLLGSTLALGLLSVRNGQSAAAWKQRDLAQVAATQQITAQLKADNIRITSLTANVKDLNGTVGSLQGKLATVQKKPSTASNVLHRLLWPFG